MAFSFIENVLTKKFLSLTLSNISAQTRTKHNFQLQRPRKRYPTWYTKSNRIVHDDYITPDNREFLKEYVNDHNQMLLAANQLKLKQQSPLSAEPPAHAEWTPYSKRTGLIVKKIGYYPMWDKEGNKISSTLLQVADNHVVKYIPPEEYVPMRKRIGEPKRKHGCLLVGAETIDPSYLTKEYYGLFAKNGVPAKKHLFRFLITDDAKLTPGTPLSATHFKVGYAVDVRGLTIDRGFQGVMRRWGFKGMPATHGVTKTHRRPGNIGGGGEKGRVWPGTKMPGHMGNRWRVMKGVEILRINTVHNVLWVRGPVAGKIGSLCYMYDTILPTRRLQAPPPFPTSYSEEDLPEDIYHEDIHVFDAPTIQYNE